MSQSSSYLLPSASKETAVSLAGREMGASAFMFADEPEKDPWKHWVILSLT